MFKVPKALGTSKIRTERHPACAGSGLAFAGQVPRAGSGYSKLVLQGWAGSPQGKEEICQALARGLVGGGGEGMQEAERGRECRKAKREKKGGGRKRGKERGRGKGTRFVNVWVLVAKRVLYIQWELN